MLKSLFTKLKDSLVRPQAKEQQPSKPDLSKLIVGYTPYTRKAIIERKIPLVMNPHIDPAVIAQCHYSAYNNIVSLISFNPSALEMFSHSLEHEAVHVDQFSNPNRTPETFYTPQSYVGLFRLYESEAHARQSYKVLHDFKTGMLNEKSLKDRNLVNQSLILMLSYSTKHLKFNMDDFGLLLKKFKDMPDMPDDTSLVFPTMYNLSANKSFMAAQTPYIMKGLEGLVQGYKEYREDTKAIGEEKTIQEFGYQIPENVFTKHLTLEDVKANVNRDSHDHFKGLKLEVQRHFFNNLITFTGSELRELKAIENNIKAYRT